MSLPPRHYDLAAELLAEAVEQAGDEPARSTLVEVARRYGRRIGGELRTGLKPRASRERRLAAVAEALERYGYEPRTERGAIRLGNCPFHSLAESHRDLVCGMNHALLEGVAEGVDAGALAARPEPTPGECCVTVIVRRKET